MIFKLSFGFVGEATAAKKVVKALHENLLLICPSFTENCEGGKLITLLPNKVESPQIAFRKIK